MTLNLQANPADGDFHTHSIHITPEDCQNFKRLDVFLSTKIKELGRTQIKQLFSLGHIRWNHKSPDHRKKIELSKLPSAGSILEVIIPPPVPMEAQAENINLNILYEDEHLLFLNKPAGLVTHPAPGHYTGTLVNGILHHCPQLSGIGGVQRPGIVHRLDKGTSGVMVVAKTQVCHQKLVGLFSIHQITRRYLALTTPWHSPSSSVMTAKGTVKSLIGRHVANRKKMSCRVSDNHGRQAITHYRVIKNFEKFSFLQLELETGRTHQIRVHLSEMLKRPILMDPLYGNPKNNLQALGEKFQQLLGDYPHPLLHAETLGLVHPLTGEKLLFTVPPPSIFNQVLQMEDS